MAEDKTGRSPFPTRGSTPAILRPQVLAVQAVALPAVLGLLAYLTRASVDLAGAILALLLTAVGAASQAFWWPGFMSLIAYLVRRGPLGVLEVDPARKAWLPCVWPGVAGVAALSIALWAMLLLFGGVPATPGRFDAGIWLGGITGSSLGAVVQQLLWYRELPADDTATRVSIAGEASLAGARVLADHLPCGLLTGERIQEVLVPRDARSLRIQRTGCRQFVHALPSPPLEEVALTVTLQPR